MREPGQQTVTIVKKPAASTVRRLPTDPDPAAPVAIAKSGCLVETQSQREDAGLANLNSELVWIFMPADADTMSITATDVLRYGSRDYQMQGPSAIEFSLDGDPVIVWCIARWEAT